MKKLLFLLLFIPIILNAREYENPFCKTIITLKADLIKKELSKIEFDFNKIKEEKEIKEKEIEDIKGYILRWGEEEDKIKKLDQLRNELENLNSGNLAIKPCDKDNLTPLHLVCRYGGHFNSSNLEQDLKEIIDKMIKLGADINAKTKILKETPIDETINCKKNCDILKNAISKHYDFNK
jgi:hypothetical protein